MRMPVQALCAVRPGKRRRRSAGSWTGGGKCRRLAFGSLREENPLTGRERNILRLAGEGLSAGEIASGLHLSYGTVRNYISEILGKLEVKSRIEAVRLAEEKGWI